jgi:hypothetical protein
MPGTMMEDLRRWLGLAAAEAAPRKAAGGPASAEALSHEAFEQRLRAILHGQDDVVAGQINIIGLGAVRQRLGARWPKVAAKADAIARRAIEQRLTPADVYVKVDGLNYLLILPELIDDAARLKCALIAEEIMKRLVGEERAGAHLDVRTAVARVDGAYVFEEMAGVAALAAKIYRPPAEPEAAPEPKTLPGDHLVYRPIWDVKRKALSTYICLPPGQGRLIDPPSLEGLDLVALDRVNRDLRRLQAQRRTVLLAVPVQYETLASQLRRQRYIEHCQTLPHLEQKLVVFEIVGVPQGLTQGRLTDLVGMLRPHARSVLLRVGLAETHFAPGPETGVHAVGLDLAEHEGADAATVAALRRFVPAANRAGLRTYVHGVRSLDLTRAALDAGFDYLDGEVITSVVGLPDGIHRFDETQLHGMARA